MGDVFMQWMAIFLAAAAVVLLTVLLWRQSRWQRQLNAEEEARAALKNTLAQGVTKQEMTLFASQLSDQLGQQVRLLNQQIYQLSGSNEARLEAVRSTMAAELSHLRAENSRQLEEMRQTVNEKLEQTLEIRLGASFRQVGERLEQVHQGLGEMQSLAAGVGDLQRLLRNVKIRGTWGEVQLGAILQQILAKEQYAENVAIDPMSKERVEYAVKIPQTEGEPLWLPIDAKCPLEDFQRLQEAEQTGDLAEKNKAQQGLKRRLLQEAADIQQKYIKPPYSTDFALLFLPLESLYAEVLQQPELCETLQQQYRVLVAGPSTLAAFLNVLQLGYRSFAIQAQAGEVWRILGLVKQEFADFGVALAKSQKKIQEAGNALEQTSRRTRVMERKLKAVEGISAWETTEETLTEHENREEGA